MKNNKNNKNEHNHTEEEEKQVRVIGFITSGEFSNDKVKNPIPENYLCETELPKELIQEMKDNGWCDENGNICFSQDFQPDPVKGEDGNVYLSMNDSSREELVMGLMMKGIDLLSTQPQ